MSRSRSLVRNLPPACASPSRSCSRLSLPLIRPTSLSRRPSLPPSSLSSLPLLCPASLSRRPSLPPSSPFTHSLPFSASLSPSSPSVDHLPSVVFSLFSVDDASPPPQPAISPSRCHDLSLLISSLLPKKRSPPICPLPLSISPTRSRLYLPLPLEPLPPSSPSTMPTRLCGQPSPPLAATTSPSLTHRSLQLTAYYLLFGGSVLSKLAADRMLSDFWRKLLIDACRQTPAIFLLEEASH